MYNAARILQGRVRNKEYQLHRNQAEKHQRKYEKHSRYSKTKIHIPGYHTIPTTFKITR